MKTLSRKEIEEIAQRVLKQYCKVSDSHAKLYRIDPEELGTKILGLDFQYRKLSQDGQILGMTSVNDLFVGVWDFENNKEMFELDGKTVLLDYTLIDEKMRGRCNFTKAHEIAHQILYILYPQAYGISYRQQPIKYCNPSQYNSHSIKNWEEWQANALASSLLLPKNLVEQGMYFFGLGDKVTLLHKDYAAKEYEQFCGLAMFLGVSKQALAIRMKQLGLLEKEYLRNPSEMLSIFKSEGDTVG